MNFLKRIILGSLLLLLPYLSKAQNLEVEVRLDTNEVLIGDQVVLHVKAEYSCDVDVELPLLNDTLAKGVEILSASPVDTSVSDDNICKLSQTYIVTAFDSGNYRIPKYNFVFSVNGGKDTLQSAVMNLLVHTVRGVDTASAVKDIKAPMDAPLSFREVLPYIGLLILLALVGAAVWFIIHAKRKNKPVFSFQKKKEPAHIIALRELDALSSEKLWQQNREKEYYTRLTDCIRRYIENRFEVKAMEQTTNEIIKDFSDKVLGVFDFKIDKNQLKTILEEMLVQADFVKFAKGLPLPDENKRHLDNAYQFVLTTKKEITEDEEEEIGSKVNKKRNKKIKKAGILNKFRLNV